ncbi:MAG TPA: hypothetical protein VNE62_00605 [Actinomycetota bacterium]|nr:hypothetical protein [Actinomycetota bacterium]
MLIRKIAATVVASLVFASGLAIGGAPAQAAQCATEVIIFTSAGGPAYDSKVLGCLTVDAGLEFNTAIIYPGSRTMQSRLTSGSAGTYCITGALISPTASFHGKCGSATVSEGLVPGTSYSESPSIAISPAGLGCVTASFDGRGHTEYCTVDRISP